MGRLFLTILVIVFTPACSSVIDNFAQLPGDGPSTDTQTFEPQSTDTEPDASLAADAGAE